MDRRSFLRASTFGGTLVSGALSAPALAQSVVNLTMVTSWSRTLVGVFDAAQRIADSINAMSDGTIRVTIKAAGEQVGPFEVFDAVMAGQADLYHSSEYYFLAKSPAYAFFTGVPFGMTAAEMNTWYYHGGGAGLHRDLAGTFGLRAFLAGNTGAQAGGWYRNPVETLDDFRGLKFRMPGLGGRALAAMGAEVVNLPGADVYEALAAGTIDGTEWIGPWADEAAGFLEITKNYYPAGFHEPCAAQALAANAAIFDGLSPHHQRIIETAAAEANAWSLSQYQYNNAAAYGRLKAAGLRVLDYSDAIWEAMGTSSQTMLDEFMSDPAFAQIHASYRTSMLASADWMSMSNDRYRAARTRIFGG